MTSFIQYVVNEFVLRCGEHVSVEWEPGSKKFDYGSVDLSVMPRRKGRSGGGGIFGKSSASKLVSKNAPERIRKDLKQQDDDLSEISKGLDTLEGMAVAIGDEVDRSTVQARRLAQQFDFTEFHNL